MDLDLKGRRAIVTGGSKGIGLATVRVLLDEGVRVVTGSRTVPDELAQTSAQPVIADLSTADGAETLVGTALEHLGGIDLLINNVGVGDTDTLLQGALTDLIHLSDDAWEHSFELHFYSALRVTRAALPSLIDNHGTVINVTSTGAIAPGTGPADYDVAKATLRALTKVIAEQYGAQGVRAITVAPGAVATGVWTDPDGMVGTLARHQGVEHEDFSRQLLESLGTSTGRIATPEEVARLIVFLASPSNITGSEHVIDGGALKSL